MNKHLLFVFGLLFLSTLLFAQTSNKKKLFIIDSLPLLKDPEEWNQLLEDDISDIKVVKNKDSLKLLGWRKFESVIYIFTKEYRKRPDSLKAIPSLKELKFENQVWNFHDIPYTGKYIDYFNSGKKQNEGNLINGMLNGEVNSYYQNGALNKHSLFINGTNTGTETSYYQNGTINLRIKYLDGKGLKSQHYFPNGQLEYDYLADKLDTLISYYSTGKIKKIAVMKNGVVVKDPIIEKINYYQNLVYQSSREDDFKNGLKYCNKIIKLDSSNETAFFFKGEFLEKQNRLDEAIREYDNAINLEPLLHYVLIKRAFARIKKYENLNNTISNSVSKEKFLIPISEIEKICIDLEQAIYCGPSEKRLTEAIAKYCETKSSR